MASKDNIPFLFYESCPDIPRPKDYKPYIVIDHNYPTIEIARIAQENDKKVREINNETECNMILTKDRIENAYQNNFIMCIPRHPLMKNAIDLCVKRYNVKFMKKVSFGSLYHTGPYLLYTASISIFFKTKFLFLDAISIDMFDMFKY